MFAAKEEKAPPNSLGISKEVYAAGNAVKDGLIATFFASAAVFAFLQYGHKIPRVGTYVEALSKGIRKFHESNYGLTPLYQKITGKPMSTQEGIGTTIGLSLIGGGLLSHFFQISGAKQGFDTAAAAIKKYNDALERIDQLENRVAQDEDIQTGRMAPKFNGSFRDRVLSAAQQTEIKETGAAKR